MQYFTSADVKTVFTATDVKLDLKTSSRHKAANNVQIVFLSEKAV